MTQDEQLLGWCTEQKRGLLEACIAAGCAAETLKIGTIAGSPFGRWNAKATVFSAGKAVAQFWVTFNRIHKRSKVSVPRFNIETSVAISTVLESKHAS